MSKQQNLSIPAQMNHSSLVYDLIQERKVIAADYFAMQDFKKRAYQFAIHFDLLQEFEYFMKGKIFYEPDFIGTKEFEDFINKKSKKPIKVVKEEISQSKKAEAPKINFNDYCTVMEYCKELGLIIDAGENLRLSKIVRQVCKDEKLEFLTPTTTRTIYPRTTILKVLQKEIFKPFPKAKTS